MTIARRSIMSLAATGAAAGLLGSASRPAPAAAPQAGSQAAGYYRFKVGEIEVTLVNEGVSERPLDATFVRNAPLPDVQAALAAAFQPTATLTIPITTAVLNTGSRLVMIDAGIGQMGPPTTGRWMANFRASGYGPDQVDTVVFSHFHGDHIQGLRAKDGTALFPNAKVMVPEAEWAFWMDDAKMAAAPEAMKGAFQGVRRVFGPIAGEVERYAAAEKEILPGLTAIPAPGHTPGHTAFVVASGDQRLLLWSDTTNKPELFVRNPGWHAVFDMDPAQAEATRRRMLDMAAAERMQVAGYHFPFPATGHIAREGDRYAYVPSFWRPQA
jgi:glyoxylase-like metal-dependent hydrolase (beta-lactamase superfamily II)